MGASVAVAVVLLPSAAKQRRVAATPAGPTQVVRVPRAVPMTAARKRAIDALLATFVPAAVERRQPLRALPLVTPAFRAGVTRADWARGNLPVMPYRAQGSRFGWTFDYSYPREMSVLFALPRPPRGAAPEGLLSPPF